VLKPHALVCFLVATKKEPRYAKHLGGPATVGEHRRLQLKLYISLTRSVGSQELRQLADIGRNPLWPDPACKKKHDVKGTKRVLMQFVCSLLPGTAIRH